MLLRLVKGINRFKVGLEGYVKKIRVLNILIYVDVNKKVGINTIKRLVNYRLYAGNTKVGIRISLIFHWY